MNHTSSHEERLARQICRILDHGTETLDPTLVERLRAARERALQRQPLAVGAPSIVGTSGTAILGDGAHNHPLRTLLAIVALLLGVAFSYYWNGFSQASENEAIDAALLADDLPPNAYLDKGFQAWLERDSESSSER